MEKKLKIVFFGTPHFVVPVLEELLKHHEILAAVTTPDQKVGRKQILTPSPIKVFAKEHTIHVLQPTSLKESLNQFATIQADLYVVAAYGKIIPKALLDLPKYGAINIHPSLLPKYRGPTPIQTAILNGESETGVTFIQMDAAMDHGPILATLPHQITTTDTSAQLLDVMFAKSAESLPKVIQDYVAGVKVPQMQIDSLATYTKILSKQDGFIDLENPPGKEQFDCMVRAYYPWPNVWTKVAVQGEQELRIKFLPENRIQMEGKQPIALKDFLNGYPHLREKIANLYKI